MSLSVQRSTTWPCGSNIPDIAILFSPLRIFGGSAAKQNKQHWAQRRRSLKYRSDFPISSLHHSYNCLRLQILTSEDAAVNFLRRYRIFDNDTVLCRKADFWGPITGSLIIEVPCWRCRKNSSRSTRSVRFSSLFFGRSRLKQSVSSRIILREILSILYVWATSPTSL